MSKSGFLGACRLVLRAAAIVLAVASADQAGAAPPPCVTPTGVDLNTATGFSEQFLTNFCTTGLAAHPWRTLSRWDTADVYSPAQTPPGFDPGGLTPADQFIAALSAVRIVVDGGTPAASSQVFGRGDFFVFQEPPDSGFVTLRAVTGPLSPLTPGGHLIQMSLILGTDHWDGIGIDPQFNLLPTGETLFNEFSVVLVPEPATLSLLVPGLMALAGWRRDARRRC
jgi:hypothetical protein